MGYVNSLEGTIYHKSSGFHALFKRAGAGHPQMVQFLLDLGADATSFAGDGKTPLEVGAGGRGVFGVGRCQGLRPPGTLHNHVWKGWMEMVLSNMFFYVKNWEPSSNSNNPFKNGG